MYRYPTKAQNPTAEPGTRPKSLAGETKKSRDFPTNQIFAKIRGGGTLLLKKIHPSLGPLAKIISTEYSRTRLSIKTQGTPNPHQNNFQPNQTTTTVILFQTLSSPHTKTFLSKPSAPGHQKNPPLPVARRDRGFQ